MMGGVNMKKYNDIIEKALKKENLDFEASSFHELVTELNIYHEELAFQTNELKYSNDKLHTQMKVNEVLFNSDVSANIGLDQTFNVILTNATADSWLGCDFKGRPIQEMFSPEQQEEVHLFLLKLKRDSKATISGLKISNKQEDKIIFISGRKEIIEEKIYFYFVCLDITKEHRQQEKIEYLAYYDQLTGTLNEDYLLKILEKRTGEKGENKYAVMLLNCRNFKSINKIYGYSYGNELLKEAANKIKSIAQTSDSVLRYNAERFILIMDDYKNTEEVRKLAQCALDLLQKPFSYQNQTVKPDVEIAILEADTSIATPDEIIQNLLMTLSYLDKSPQEHIKFYTEDMLMNKKREELVIEALNSVIKGDTSHSFYLEFQPKIDLMKNRVMGFEALARLNIESVGQISPIEFIKIAEKEFMIHELGKVIYSKGFEFLNQLKKENLNDLVVAINVSGNELLRDDFISNIKDSFNYNKIKPDLLEIELTESILIDDFNLINTKFNELKAMGILISIDDFGTGFSSLSRLQDLNVDFIKIDKLFIDKIGQGSEENIIIDEIISMCQKMKLKVIAEGVEEKSQVDYLTKHGCDIIQGYYYSKPLPAKKAIEFIKSYNLK